MEAIGPLGSVRRHITPAIAHAICLRNSQIRSHRVRAASHRKERARRVMSCPLQLQLWGRCRTTTYASPTQSSRRMQAKCLPSGCGFTVPRWNRIPSSWLSCQSCLQCGEHVLLDLRCLWLHFLALLAATALARATCLATTSSLFRASRRSIRAQACYGQCRPTYAAAKCECQTAPISRAGLENTRPCEWRMEAPHYVSTDKE